MRKMQIYCKLDRNTVQYHGTDSVQIRYKNMISAMRKIPAPLTRQTADSEALQWLQVVIKMLHAVLLHQNPIGLDTIQIYKK